MRIVAGRFRGRALTPLGKGDPAAHLRPTTDRVREALFNMLGGGRFGDPFEGAVLDLFAGTGALGLEAISRGNDSVTFVESGRKAQRILQSNINLLNVSDETRIISRDATRLPLNTTAPARLVFLDPPYGKGLGAAALKAAALQNWVAEDVLVVWEENAQQSPPEGFELLDVRRYGDTTISLMGRV
ncbi:16S rRNA (guanine(966)-N(2))-methyltransferase RsmD [Primorskyibacter sp. S187A]|uniref:16S rRNA (guanine(966)-N(2))-methyltransferase RsmD n=1 Tax=Primorskyibacter sp. S187A TaxID=3415130 RepID=UPI003C79A5C0